MNAYNNNQIIDAMPAPNTGNLDPINQLSFDFISESFRMSDSAETEKKRRPNGNKGFMKMDRFCRKHKFCRSTVYKHVRNGNIPKSKILPPTAKTPTLRIHSSAITDLNNDGVKPRFISRCNQTNKVIKLMSMPDKVLINTVNKYGVDNILNLLCKIEDKKSE